MKIPAKLDDSQITICVDNREQTPWTFDSMQTKPASLQSGDYQISGIDWFCIERKSSIEELCAMVGRDRDRFERELARLAAFRSRHLILETDWRTIEAGQWRGKITPAQVVGSLNAWQVRYGLSIVLAGNRHRANRIATDLIRKAATHEYRRLRTFAAAMDQKPEPAERDYHHDMMQGDDE